MAPNTGNDQVLQNDEVHVPEKVPTLVELKRILPKHCFVGDPIRSLSFAVKDLAIVAATYGFMMFLNYNLPEDSGFRVLMWLAYWFFQGTMFWALFVVAHDCGHGSFSGNSILNDTVGNILNTFILVPYYAWKLSHKYFFFY